MAMNWMAVLLLFVSLANQRANGLAGRVKKDLDSSSTDAIDLEQPVVVTSVDDLLPKQQSLFQVDAIDQKALQSMDCHLRNIDYCYAGMLGSGQRALPETDPEFEVRCDEMKAATSCLAVYNARCATLKVFAALAPFSQIDQVRQLSRETGAEQAPLPAQVESILMNRNVSSDQNSTSAANDDNRIRAQDLMTLCEPDAKQSKQNRLIRERIFQLAKCINQRIGTLRPCIEDLRTALQLFFEPKRSLPMKPVCCALARFQHCAMDKLDNICGLSSLRQLQETMASSGAGSALRAIDRVCSQASKHDSAYCQDILPTSGLKLTPRRGSKASKLAKALDLISYAPAVAT